MIFCIFIKRSNQSISQSQLINKTFLIIKLAWRNEGYTLIVLISFPFLFSIYKYIEQFFILSYTIFSFPFFHSLPRRFLCYIFFLFFFNLNVCKTWNYSIGNEMNIWSRKGLFYYHNIYIYIYIEKWNKLNIKLWK